MRACWILGLCAACGGGGESPIDTGLPPPDVTKEDGRLPDAPELENEGFGKPTRSLKANVEQAPDTWVEVGPADLSCLGTPGTDAATTVTVAAATSVRDFQSAAAIVGASVRAFPGTQVGSPFGAAATSGAAGNVTVTLPTGTTRFGFDVTTATALRTLVINVLPSPTQATQTFPPLRSFSATTAQTLPALVGIARTPGTALTLGVLRDCQGREVSNFIATVSVTAGAVLQVAGADTYYFSSSVGLPVRHSQRAEASEDGQFMVIELVPTAGALIQVWGYPTDADLAADQLRLVAEIPAPVLEDTVSSAALEPLRQ